MSSISKPKQFQLPRIFPRPKSHKGLWYWLATVDHKKIGTMYGLVSFFWFLVGGIEALLIRLQLGQAESSILSPEVYNQMFTMHGTTMVFLVVMPLSAAFFNWIVPLQIGARDVAFPRLNALSLWVFIFGSILMNISWFAGGAPNGGWFGYPPNSSLGFNPGNGITYWIMGLNVLGVASIAAGLNFIVTIINMRAPGLHMMRLPVFTWMTLITSVLIVLALPILAVAGIQLTADRIYGTNFFNSEAGGDPIFWQHIFWLFGHPEVYILILPAMGIVSEVLPTFSRKPLFGYTAIVFAGLVIGFMGWFVWSHHMFTVGLGPAANTAFTVTTMLIAIPTGVKIFNWISTLWGGSIKLNTSMLFSIGFIAMFTIGGLSGVTHAASPSDAQQQDTYYVVAHFHYVLFGGSIFAIFSGIYYWWPKFTGWLLDEKLGIISFILMFIGFNLQFGPMHWVGLNGMPRRIYTYAEDMGWESSNLAATIGGFIIALSVLVFLVNVILSKRNKQNAGGDPWDARTLEWSIASPPPHYNFVEIPKVNNIDDWWYRKYPELLEGNNQNIKKQKIEVEDSSNVDESKIHLPDLSYYPLLIGVGLTIAALGVMYTYALVVIGLVMVFWGSIGWSTEPVNEDSNEHH
ncbi:MAG: cytochrome c oxidase subunit I [Chloroflexota bacterium]|nr:cytochrome c oxidase subunit I [Chloroflexota bacterium]